MVRSRLPPRTEAKLGKSTNGDRPVIEPFAFAPGGQQNFAQVMSSPDVPRWVWLRGGIGSGKTTCAGIWFCERRRIDPEAQVLITANDYPQLSRSTLVGLANTCRRHGIPLDPLYPEDEETARIIAARGFCHIHGRYVFVISANSFSGGSESGRGTQFRTIWADEIAYSSKGTIDTLNGRLGRGAGKYRGQGLISSSINKHDPFNFMYELFDDPKRSPETQQIYRSVRVSCEDNPHLDPDYIPSLKAAYTPELYIIEVLGEYAPTSENRAFNHFSRDRHLQRLLYQPGLKVCVSFDFNCSPACAIIAQLQGNTIQVIKEFYLLNSDTFALSANVAAYLVNLGVISIDLFGDSSGNQRTANSQQSNWQIVSNALTESGISFITRYGAANPSIVDTLNSTNALLKNFRLYVDTDCVELTRDLEVLKRKGKEIDKSDKMRSHLADCLRYLAHTLFPMEEEGRKTILAAKNARAANSPGAIRRIFQS